MPTPQSVTFTFQSPSGEPISGGTVTVRLNQDIAVGVSSGPQVSANRLVSAPLDSNGAAVVQLWPNTGLSPSSVYTVTAYTVLGQQIWQGEVNVGE